MPNKDAIIENVDQYDARELVKFIDTGVVTFDELCEEPSFSAKARREVKNLLNQGVAKEKEEKDWAEAQSSRSVEALETYLQNYPRGAHREEARRLKQELENPIPPTSEDKDKDKDKDEVYGTSSLKDDIDWLWKDGASEKEIYDHIMSKCGNSAKAEVLALMKEDPNVIPSEVLRLLKDNNVLKGIDLESIGINRKFIDAMVNKMGRSSFSIPQKLEKINKQSTEVYFWGIPDSGKSCALGAILSTAYNGGVAQSMVKDNDCQGYDYMMRLSSLFSMPNQVFALPEKTATTSTYEMGFDLVDKNGRTHPITCIDLAGELMRCMYKNDAHINMTVDERDALDTLTNILIDNRTGNRKIHFFVLEYGAENRKYEGLTQAEYLDAAYLYIKRTQIFEKDTDAIFLMITKVDKIKAEVPRRKEIIEEYIKTYYQGFYNNLKKLCTDKEINNGKVDIRSFSLGEVCMKYYCLFDNSAAKAIVQLLIDRSKGFKSGRRGRLERIFKG